jgi:sec-independent protein translocase protein TatB
MFDISGPDFLVLIVAALFILGPERLPGAARWLGQTVRKVREYATGARDQLAAEVGDDFDQLRKPLQDLARLRNGDARKALAQQILDASGAYDPRDDLRDIVTLPRDSHLASPAATTLSMTAVSADGRPPFDPDAT